MVLNYLKSFDGEGNVRVVFRSKSQREIVVLKLELTCPGLPSFSVCLFFKKMLSVLLYPVAQSVPCGTDIQYLQQENEY